MPIEIKELHIRVAVTAFSAGQPTKGMGGAGGAGIAGADDERRRDQIVAECVEQVLGIIEGKRER